MAVVVMKIRFKGEEEIWVGDAAEITLRSHRMYSQHWSTLEANGKLSENTEISLSPFLHCL